MITTEVVTEVGAFRDLRQEWSELLKASASDCLFLTWEWMFTWWQHLAGTRTLHIILVRREGLLIALAPLALGPSRLLPSMPFTMLEFIASCSVGSDYLDIIVRREHEEHAVRAMADCLAKANDVVEFVRVEKASFLMVSLVLQLRQRGWQSISQSTNYCPFIDLTNLTWESYLEGLRRSHRHDIQKRLKRLNKEFVVEIQLAQTESQRQSAMANLLRLHMDRWSKEGGSTAFNSPELVSFHGAVSRLFLERGWLRLYTLLLNGIPAGGLYVFNYNGVCYYYQAAFNTDYGKYSVGLLLLALCIKSAIEEGAREFDLLHDDEEYKYLWAREERGLMRVELFPPRNKGKIFRQAVLMKGGLKKLLVHFNLYQAT
jgi:CelD/BcsL family acetyltransferase involved in cellulose biosynthesis